jgi:hypothetical protein
VHHCKSTTPRCQEGLPLASACVAHIYRPVAIIGQLIIAGKRYYIGSAAVDGCVLRSWPRDFVLGEIATSLCRALGSARKEARPALFGIAPQASGIDRPIGQDVDDRTVTPRAGPWWPDALVL